MGILKNVNTLVFILILMPLLAQKKPIIDRIEPGSWWTSMHHPQLQLLVHGSQIQDLLPVIEYQGVTLDRVITVDNPNYLFLDLSLAPDTLAGVFNIGFQRNGDTVFTYRYELKSREPESRMREGFSNKDIMYLITPDRFANGSSDNDRIVGMREKPNREAKGGRHGGDIQGIIDHLDYLHDMGFTALWINPVLENDMPTYSYHGYATTDYYKVDPRFGTNADYLRLAAEAKKKGIKIIMDLIVNHCGLYHWWTGDQPTADWYNFQGDQEKPLTSHKRVSLSDPYATKADIEMLSDGWFVPTMPDLNQKNPLLANYLIQNSIWWIEYADLGGIRQDTYTYPDPGFMTQWSKRIMEEYPQFNIVGEEWSVNPAIVSRWQAGKHNSNGYVSHLPSLFDFPLQFAITESLNKKMERHTETFDPLYEMLANDFLYPDPFNLVVFLDNHDMPRFIDQVHGNIESFKMGLIYLFSTRGIPQLFYGTEVLLGNKKNSSDHGLIRADMPGGWKNDKVNAFTGKGLTADQKDIKDMVGKLARFRKKTSALQNGNLKHYAPFKEVYTMFRYDEATMVMSIFNKNGNTTEVDLTRFAEYLQDAKTAMDVLTGKSFDLSKGILAIPGLSAMMLTVDR
ncbi:MAG: glycoside hydrolase family 13 protein [Flavobacteriaceae bacterium]